MGKRKGKEKEETGKRGGKDGVKLNDKEETGKEIKMWKKEGLKNDTIL